MTRSLALPDGELAVLAQRDARGGDQVVPCWREGVRSVWDLGLTIARLRPQVLHVQHELRILGGVVPGLLFLPVLWLVARRTPVVLTFHGVVPRDEVPRLLGAGGRLKATMARLLLQSIFRAYARIATTVIVHHDYFAEILRAEYDVPPPKITVVPMGYLPPEVPRSRSTRCGPLRILVFGFLADYKRPEDVLELMARPEPSDLHLSLGVALNPRNRNAGYVRRFEGLRQRSLSLEPRVEWLGYVPDEALRDVVANSDVLVLPYTSCIAVSGVVTWALEQGVPVAYDSRIAPLLGAGASAYRPTPASMEQAIRAAASGGGQEGLRSAFAPWSQVADLTRDVWLGAAT